MQRELRSSPAYDFRGQTPNYGQHPLELHFLIKGDAGALVFSVNTGWRIDRTQRIDDPSPSYVQLTFHMHPTDPQVPEDELHDDCGWLDGATCHCSSPFGFTGDRLTVLRDGLVAKGTDWLWTKLETIYKELS